MAGRGNAGNLTPVRSVEEARDKGRKGGLASGVSRRDRKTLRAMLEMLMDMPAATEDGPAKSNREAMAVAIVQRALAGDVKAFEVVRDTLGEKPRDKVDASLSGGLEISWKE